MIRHHYFNRRRLSLHLLAGLIIFVVWASAARGDSFYTTNLVTDNQTANPALITDANLVNAWGISFSPTGPFWVSANDTGVSTLYNVNPVTNAASKLALEVSIPGDGSVTGQVFNGTPSAFNGDSFLFVSEDGTISGWRGALGTSAEILQTASATADYRGVALATMSGHTYLYAANFASGKIDILKGDAAAPGLAGTFTDPTLPTGYAPFNIQLLGGKLYVTYAMQDSSKKLQVGQHSGIVSVFDTQGNFLGRVGTGDALNAPWGLAIAPQSFGSFAGDLLVGNFGDGAINAFDLTANTFVGQLTGLDGNPLMIEGLWGLTAGNGVNAGSTNMIYFSAGPGDEPHGLFGSLAPQAVPEPGTMLLIGSGLVGLVGFRRRFKK